MRIDIKKTKKEFLDYFLNKKISNILDLGCSRGYLSKYLIKEGVNVVGVDKNKKCESSKNFKFVLKDINDFDFNKKYSLIICSLVLHYFKKEKALNLIKKIKKSTKTNGYNFIVCISNKDDVVNDLDLFYPSINELKKVYFDWKIIKKVYGFTKKENHGKRGEHKHHLIFLLVKNGK
jgi:cyclopropane fatty-acyl-phospholipid synthase-like methyltransferase